MLFKILTGIVIIFAVHLLTGHSSPLASNGTSNPDDFYFDNLSTNLSDSTSTVEVSDIPSPRRGVGRTSFSKEDSEDLKSYNIEKVHSAERKTSSGVETWQLQKLIDYIMSFLTEKGNSNNSLNNLRGKEKSVRVNPSNNNRNNSDDLSTVTNDDITKPNLNALSNISSDSINNDRMESGSRYLEDDDSGHTEKDFHIDGSEFLNVDNVSTERNKKYQKSENDDDKTSSGMNGVSGEYRDHIYNGKDGTEENKFDNRSQKSDNTQDVLNAENLKQPLNNQNETISTSDVSGKLYGEKSFTAQKLPSDNKSNKETKNILSENPKNNIVTSTSDHSLAKTSSEIQKSHSSIQTNRSEEREETRNHSSRDYFSNKDVDSSSDDNDSSSDDNDSSCDDNDSSDDNGSSSDDNDSSSEDNDSSIYDSDSSNDYEDFDSYFNNSSEYKFILDYLNDPLNCSEEAGEIETTQLPQSSTENNENISEKTPEVIESKILKSVAPDQRFNNSDETLLNLTSDIENSRFLQKDNSLKNNDNTTESSENAPNKEKDTSEQEQIISDNKHSEENPVDAETIDSASESTNIDKKESKETYRQEPILIDKTSKDTPIDVAKEEDIQTPYQNKILQNIVNKSKSTNSADIKSKYPSQDEQILTGNNEAFSVKSSTNYFQENEDSNSLKLNILGSNNVYAFDSVSTYKNGPESKTVVDSDFKKSSKKTNDTTLKSSTNNNYFLDSPSGYQSKIESQTLFDSDNTKTLLNHNYSPEPFNFSINKENSKPLTSGEKYDTILEYIYKHSDSPFFKAIREQNSKTKNQRNTFA